MFRTLPSLQFGAYPHQGISHLQLLWDIHNLCNVVMYVKWRHRLDNVAEIEKK